MAGTIEISRELIHHPIVGIQHPERYIAWTWMLVEARWKTAEKPILIAGKPVILERGQLSHSLRFMADKLPLSVQQLRTFLKRLQNQHMIKIENNTGQQVITICNYDKYQLAPSDINTASTQRATRDQHSINTASTQRRIPEAIPEEIPESISAPPGTAAEPDEPEFSSADIYWGFVKPLASRAELPEGKVRPILGKLLKAAGGEPEEILQHVAFAISEDCKSPISFLMQKANDLTKPKYIESGVGWSPFQGDMKSILAGPRE